MNDYHLLLDELIKCKEHLGEIVKAYDAEDSKVSWNPADGFYRYMPEDMKVAIKNARFYLSEKKMGK